MTLENIGEREMDRLCWCLVSTRNRFYPPNEKAKECIEQMYPDIGDMIEDGNGENDLGKITAGAEVGRKFGDEEGYHRGMFIARDMFMEQLYGYGINVLARANRYTYMNRKYDMEFRTDDEPDYYRAARGGAEVTVHQWINNDIMSPDELESLDWPADYVPSGADVEDE